MADPLKAEVDRIIAKGNPWQAVALLWAEIERLRREMAEGKEKAAQKSGQ